MDEEVDRKWWALSEESLTELKVLPEAQPKVTFREIDRVMHERKTLLEAQLLEESAQASASRE